MIIAIVLCDQEQPLIQGKAPYFLRCGEETLIERVMGTVLRGPFGGTFVLTVPALADELSEALAGFAVQPHVVSHRPVGSWGGLQEVLTLAEAFRARWQQTMAAASKRFAGDPHQPHAGVKGELSKHRRSPDVKLRGLAQSFERDGVIIFRGERPVFRPELPAQIVDRFGAEAGELSRHRFGQAVRQGVRGYPIIMDLEAVREMAALPPATGFEAWLSSQAERLLEIPVDDPAVTECVDSDAAYQHILQRLALKPG